MKEEIKDELADKQADEEIRKFHERQEQMDLIDKENPLPIHKRLHEINTFQCVDNELYLRGKDEWGNDFTLCFDAFNFLEWIDKEHLKYIKKQLIKYIKTK